MKHAEFHQKIMSELTPTEIALINTNIYYNPDYIEYYMNYHSGQYQECFDFLIAHRNLLTIDHTPKKWQKVAKQLINAKLTV